MKLFFQLIVFQCLLISCAWAASPPSSPNVILITIDTVRADHLGCYGYKQIQTPTIDGLARDGIVFDRAISQVPLTWPSHAAILTGTYPFQNGVQDFTGQPLAPQFRSIAQMLHDRGYATGAVVSAFVLDRSWGLSRGFDFYDDAFTPGAYATQDLGLIERRAGDSVTRAIAWAAKNSQKPFFLWLHLYDPHRPYDPPEPFRTRYRNHPYDGEIAYADHELGRLISWLKKNHLYDKSLITLLSDHGESLGEHGEEEHGFFVYNSTVHIPLIVKPPAGSGFRPTRIGRAVATIAVAPTIADFARGSTSTRLPSQFQFRGLLDKKASNDDEAYSESFYSFSSFGWSPLHALQTSRYQYVDAPVPELYDLASDPEEKNNLASQQAATVAVLKDKLQALLRQNPFIAKPDSSAPINPDSLEKLRALGYVAYRSPVSSAALAEGLPDPKSKLWEFNAILRAGDEFRAGDFSAGVKLLDSVAQKDPQMYVVPFLKGEAAARQQKWTDASEAFQKCLKLNPAFDQAMTGLARALFTQGDMPGAESWLQKALQQNPQNFRGWFELGSLHAKVDRGMAISDYQKAVAIQPNFAQAWRELGMLQSQQRDYEAAAKSLARANELGLDDPGLFNFLGIAYSRTNRQKQAITSYQKALKSNPQMAEAHLNLAYSYDLLHQTQSAHREYQEACRLRSDFCKFDKQK